MNLAKDGKLCFVLIFLDRWFDLEIFDSGGSFSASIIIKN